MRVEKKYHKIGYFYEYKTVRLIVCVCVCVVHFMLFVNQRPAAHQETPIIIINEHHQTHAYTPTLTHTNTLYYDKNLVNQH